MAGFTFHIVLIIIKSSSSILVDIGASFLPLAFETFGKTSDETLSLIRDLVGKAAEINI